ncbi:uncharacterized protein LOC126581325 [Anopheles aquasalis]|uniref:uncharacterized protein LOC126581325 n=1 Tax=Anopheles aquasalis TaxID=42839 RepID=UPI00215A8841|nr:uncharacterized protein LOC126581325 [Anopheles aquasalis]XP_050100866.1 uncharacterized protein LOC126581325 [Anopheles aquasalis]XP_050100873.1 uncharacterized protein LOC126581325 [Anopheles aquasalis]XP_050100882.1 uncharacterized protein LOC126581325 [Anopheles aquasalis]XP_050100892.1 uncharacterized protein LOC126581325 [Anopheles aquasalis]XP_050100901.1 uncharacterized protein LOC126581325 [Anopheles aquasalis]XP_050100908.1 uncharacterized protein LOC126581325 [Anopheles aquasali
MLSSVWTSLGKEQGLARALKQKIDETSTRSGSSQRRKPIPPKPPRRKNQQQEVPPFQNRSIVTASPSPAFHPKATSSMTTPTSQHIMGVAEKNREDREHCDDECAHKIITKAFHFLTRPKRGRDMTASEILECYLERQQAQLGQQSAVVLDMNTCNSSFTSTLTYFSNLDTTVLAGNDDSKIGLSGTLLAAEEQQQELTTKTIAPDTFGDVPAKWVQHQPKHREQKLPKGRHTGLHNSYQEAMRESQEEIPMNGQQHIYEPIVIPSQPQMISTPIVTSTTSGCNREHRWHNVWRKLKHICLSRRNRRQKNQPTVDEQPRTNQQVPSSTCSSNNLHQQATLNTGLGSRFDSHRQSMKKSAKNRPFRF